MATLPRARVSVPLARVTLPQARVSVPQGSMFLPQARMTAAPWCGGGDISPIIYIAADYLSTEPINHRLILSNMRLNTVPNIMNYLNRH